MHAVLGPVDLGKLNFERGELMIPARVRRPLAERMLVRYPRLAWVLSALGARAMPSADGKERGRLAAMMTASRSIDPVAGSRNSFRFYIRPMS